MWSPTSWHERAAGQQPKWPDAGRARTLAEADLLDAAAGVRRRGTIAADRTRPRRRRQRVPAPGRRLCRELRRLLRRHHQGEAAGHPADGDHPHLLRRCADREGRPDRRPVRQAAVVRHGTDRRHRDPVVPRPHRQRPDRVGGGPHPEPRAARPGVPPVRVDAQPAAGVHQGRFRRPVTGARLDPGVRVVQPGGPALRAARRRDRSGARVHAGLRHRDRVELEPVGGRRVDLARGPDPRLRGSAHPPGLPDRRMVRLLGPHAVDRGTNPRTRRRTHRVPAWRRQPARLQDRPDHVGRVPPRAVRESSTRTAFPVGSR